MKVAILHEMLVKLGWAEKVVLILLDIFKWADLFTLIYDEKKVWTVFPKYSINKQVFRLRTQKIYNIFKNQRLCLNYMASSVESLDFSSYDLVISSSSSFAHWAITKPETKFIVYYHSPSRYLWDYTNEYKKSIWWDKWFKSFILNNILLKNRAWDFIASHRNDLALVSSYHVWKRIEKYYKKDNYKVIYPPVDIDVFINYPTIERKDYYVTISALTEFKRLDISINAFNNMQDKNLIIIWTWNYEQEYKKMAKHSNIKFVWFSSLWELVKFLKEAKGFIFTCEEDFWIVPIEAMAAWLPVFALKLGWLVETVIEDLTWEFFLDKNWLDFKEKFLEFDKNIDNNKYDRDKISSYSNKFNQEIFKKSFIDIIESIIDK